MISIALVTGGDNGEKEVSLRSAETFLQYLDKNMYSVTVFHFPHDTETFLNQLSHFHFVIPVIHGIGGEDGEITRLCEEAGISYFFTDSKTHKICIDKYVCGETVRQLGYGVPLSWHIQQEYASLPTYNGKVFIKPVHGGSSVDSGVFNTIEAGKNLIDTILLYDDALVQKCVSGREFTVSVDGDWNNNPHVLAISEIITGQSFFDYEAKYSLKNTHEVTPAILDKLLEERIADTALAIYTSCRILCLGRIDFIYDEKNDILYFLEINTIPGFTETSFFPQAITHNGLSISQYLDTKITSILEKNNAIK